MTSLPYVLSDTRRNNEALHKFITHKSENACRNAASSLSFCTCAVHPIYVRQPRFNVHVLPKGKHINWKNTNAMIEIKLYELIVRGTLAKHQSHNTHCVSRKRCAMDTCLKNSSLPWQPWDRVLFQRIQSFSYSDECDRVLDDLEQSRSRDLHRGECFPRERGRLQI